MIPRGYKNDTDPTQMDRTAQLLYVQYKRSSGSPPTFAGDWNTLGHAKVEQIVRNANSTPSTCMFYIPDARWDADTGIKKSDMVQIVTVDGIVIFQGFITGRRNHFFGGNQEGGGYERSLWIAHSYMWLLTLCPIFGQYARGYDDYSDVTTNPPTPKDGAYTFLGGRRCIFNENGYPNADPTAVMATLPDTTTQTVTLFGDVSLNTYWKTGDMIKYLIAAHNKMTAYFSIPDISAIVGLSDSAWNKVLGNVVVEGLHLAAAIELICKQINWSFKEIWTMGGPQLVFYKTAGALASSRTAQVPIILHDLYAPQPDEKIDDAVKRGEKLLWGADWHEDIEQVINDPWGIGVPHRFEITVPLVPGWKDSDLSPDTSHISDDASNTLFVKETDAQKLSDPNSVPYCANYRFDGSSFKADVGRIWVLNEAGLYTGAAGGYDRGSPFDWSTVIPDTYGKDTNSKRLFGPFNRVLLNSLTVNPKTLSSVGIIVEFSFDAGTTWAQIPCSIVPLKDRCGIYIKEPNLCEIVDTQNRKLQGGTLDQVECDYWTSICADKLYGRVWKSNQWATRIRVTASVCLDQRLQKELTPAVTGSPFYQADLIDLSDRYNLSVRTASSIYASSSLAAATYDQTDQLTAHLQTIQDTNSDAAFAGQFTLERLWLHDAEGWPVFDVGDGIWGISGRTYPLQSAAGGDAICPEIVQIIYLPDKQKMKLITRDLRFSEHRQ